MSMVVGGVAGVVGWLAAMPLASRFVVRRRRDVAIWATLSSVSSALACRSWGVSWLGAVSIVLVVGFMVLAEIDVKCRKLPREVSYPLAAIALLLVAVSALSRGDAHLLVEALIGVVVATSSMSVLYVLSRGGLGDGDVRLAPAIGTTAAFGGVSTLWVTMFVAFVAAGVFVLMGLALGRMNRSSAIPFGPFLIGGSIVAILVS